MTLRDWFINWMPLILAVLLGFIVFLVMVLIINPDLRAQAIGAGIALRNCTNCSVV